MLLSPCDAIHRYNCDKFQIVRQNLCRWIFIVTSITCIMRPYAILPFKCWCTCICGVPATPDKNTHIRCSSVYELWMWYAHLSQLLLLLCGLYGKQANKCINTRKSGAKMSQIVVYTLREMETFTWIYEWKFYALRNTVAATSSASLCLCRDVLTFFVRMTPTHKTRASSLCFVRSVVFNDFDLDFDFDFFFHYKIRFVNSDGAFDW